MSTPPGWTPDPRERDEWGRPVDDPSPADPAPPAYGPGPGPPPWRQPAAPPGYGPGAAPPGQPPGYGTGPEPASPPWQRPGQPARTGPGGYPGHGAYPPQPGYPYPGYPPPPPDAQPGRSNRRVLALVAGLAVAAIVLLGAVAVVALRGNPRDTADEFIAALKAKDVDRAHSLLCKDGQQKESKEDLRRSFDLDDRTITSYRLGTERIRQREGKDETLVPVTIDYDQGAEVKVDVGVWNEGGQKVCSLNPPDDG